MGLPAAKKNDRIVGVDIHIVMITTPAGPVPTPLPSPFLGAISDGVSTSVKIMGQFAAVVGSQASNQPSHIPIGGPFQKAPTNKGRVMAGSPTVFINGKPAARVGDMCMTCGDPVDAPTAAVVTVGPVTVMIG
jgi:uncharacterized Zn-binding protein involved in type VI secretion